MHTARHPAGVIVPLLTPVDRDEKVQFAQLDALVDHVIEGGVDGIFVMGTSGEFARFTMDEREQIIRATVQRACGRVPVYAGVSDCGERLVKIHMERAAKAGADAVVSTVPYYFPTVSEKEMISFFQHIADFSPVPVVMYNIPVAVGASLTCRVIGEVCGHPNIVSVKDSSADPVFLDKLLARFQSEDFSVLVGDESLLHAGFLKGVDGCIPSMANPFPRLLAALYRACVQKDEARLAALCGVVNRFNLINKYCDSWMSPNLWRKTALQLMGIMGDCFTAPCEPVDEATRLKVEKVVAEYTQMVELGQI